MIRCHRCVTRAFGLVLIITICSGVAKGESPKTLRVTDGSVESLSFTLPEVPSALGEAVLSFRVLALSPSAKGLAGWDKCLNILVNNHPIGLWTPELRPRIKNKPVLIWPRGNMARYFRRMYVTNTDWAVFIAKNFDSPAEDDPYLPLEGDPFAYTITVTDLVRAGDNQITFKNTRSKNPLVIEGCQLDIRELSPKPVDEWRKEGPLPLVSSRNRILAAPFDHTKPPLLTDDVIRYKAEHFPLIIDNSTKMMLSHDVTIVPGLAEKFRKANPDCRIIRYYCPTNPFWVCRDQPLNLKEGAFEHLFENWGFEQGLKGWEAVNVQIVEDEAHSGKKAAEIGFGKDKGFFKNCRNPGTGQAKGWLLSEPIKIPAGRGIKLSAWMKVEKVEGPGACIFVQFYSDAEGTQPIGEPIESPPLTGSKDWTLRHLGEWSQEYSSKPCVTAPDNAKSMRMGLMLRGRGRVLFDDVGRVFFLSYQPSSRDLSNVDIFNVMPDWGSKAFREFITGELEHIIDSGLDGIFFDQLFSASPPYDVVAMPYDYELSEWRSNAVGLLKDITGLFDRRDKVLIANNSPIPSARYDYLPYVHGVVTEQMFSVVAKTEDDGFPEEDRWKFQVGAVFNGQKSYPNRAFVPLSPINPTDYRLRTFVLASYMLIRGDYCYLATIGRSSDAFDSPEREVGWYSCYRAEFDVDLGAATALLEPVPGTDCHVYTRRFEKGQVFVCAGGSGPYEVSFERPCELMEIYGASLDNMAGELKWNRISKLTITPKNAAIVRWAQ